MQLTHLRNRLQNSKDCWRIKRSEPIREQMDVMGDCKNCRECEGYRSGYPAAIVHLPPQKQILHQIINAEIIVDLLPNRIQ